MVTIMEGVKERKDKMRSIHKMREKGKRGERERGKGCVGMSK